MVPNKHPTQYSDKRIAIIGEFPTYEDESQQQPFASQGGRFLKALLSRAGVQADACFFGNICQSVPPSQDISKLAWNSADITEGLAQLKQDINEYKPNIILLLGNLPLKAAKDPASVHPLLPKAYRYKVGQWRGSLFLGEPGSFAEGYKCLASYHPIYCLRAYDDTPMLQFDLRKAVREGTSPILRLPERRLQVGLSCEQQLAALRELRIKQQLVSLDIEGGIDTMSCISFATSPENAFIIPINENTTVEIWQALASVLEDPLIPKVLQNSLYDRFVLHFSYGIRMRGIVHDTMLKHWELYSELEKSLGVQASLYTDEPYYKFERKADDWDTFYKYCCKDSAITLEISNKLEHLVSGVSRQHYEFNVALLNPLLYMELRGIKYDVRGAADRRRLLQSKLYTCQAELNGLTGHGFSWTKGLDEIKQKAKDIMLTKKGDRVRKEYETSWLRIGELISDKNPSLATIGELENLCEVNLNVGSQKQFQSYLYETLKLPVQMSNVRGQEPHVTSDYEALLKLSRECIQKGHALGLAVVQKAIEIRALQTRQQMLSIGADRDSRIRCGYNLVGTNTGRITCYESPTGSGYNLQTIPNYTEIKDAPGGVLGDRDLFMADDGHWIFQCDLSGADGWTVAAYCAMLGDPTMLEHYRNGIKPYAAIALKLAGRSLNYKNIDELKAATKKWKMSDGEKLTAKRVQHGGAYLEGGLTISRNVLKDSEGKLYISPSECDKLKNWYLREMYPGIPKWHDWIGRRLRERPVLTAASGQVRQFFGRPDDIITKAVAFEPQSNTTYATNLAAHRLWTDKENRTRTSDRLLQGCYLRIEPLHQIHDALLGQFLKSDTAWAVSKIQSYFANALTIAGQQITIPFEGAYGRSWGQLTEGKI